MSEITEKTFCKYCKGPLTLETELEFVNNCHRKCHYEVSIHASRTNYGRDNIDLFLDIGFERGLGCIGQKAISYRNQLGLSKMLYPSGFRLTIFQNSPNQQSNYRTSNKPILVIINLRFFQRN